MAALVSYKHYGTLYIKSFNTVYQALLFIEIMQDDSRTEWFMMCGKFLKQEVALDVD